MEIIVPKFESLEPGTILFTKEQLLARAEGLAGDVSRDFAGLRPVIFPILKGGEPFFDDIVGFLRRDHPDFEFDTDAIRMTTYRDGRNAGIPQILESFSMDVSGRILLGIDDVADTNVTGKYAAEHATNDRGAASFELLAMIIKLVENKVRPDPKRFGFYGPPAWLAGKGMDAGEKDDPDAGRDLPHVIVWK